MNIALDHAKTLYSKKQRAQKQRFFLFWIHALFSTKLVSFFFSLLRIENQFLLWYSRSALRVYRHIKHTTFGYRGLCVCVFSFFFFFFRNIFLKFYVTSISSIHCSCNSMSCRNNIYQGTWFNLTFQEWTRLIFSFNCQKSIPSNHSNHPRFILEILCS